MMITINIKNDKNIKQLAKELRHWHRTFWDSETGSDEEYEASVNKGIVYSQIIRTGVKCMDCKHYKIVNNRNVCHHRHNTLRSLNNDWNICYSGQFEFKTPMNRFQMF